MWFTFFFFFYFQKILNNKGGWCCLGFAALLMFLQVAQSEGKCPKCSHFLLRGVKFWVNVARRDFNITRAVIKHYNTYWENLEDTQNFTGSGHELPSVQISGSSCFEQAGLESSRLLSHPKFSRNSVGIWVHLAFKTSLVPSALWEGPQIPWGAGERLFVVAAEQKAEGDGCAQPRGQENSPQMGQDDFLHCHSSHSGTGVCWEEFLLQENLWSQNTLLKPKEIPFYPSTSSSLCSADPSLLLMSPLKSH